MFIAADIEDRRSCAIDFKHILDDKSFIEGWTNFEQDVLQEPEHTLNCLGLAVHQVSGSSGKLLLLENN